MAKNDRKLFSIYKYPNISRNTGHLIYKILFEKNIIKKEYTQESPIKKYPKQKIKKNLKNYKVEDKIHFVDEFTRFWFTFIAPNLKLLEEEKYDQVIEIIKIKFNEYVSLSFEILSFGLLNKFYEINSLDDSGGYWSKRSEIDLLIQTKNGLIIAGESKWKDRKICKNILTLLQNKCERLNLQVDKFALFSKSGFSKELEKLNSDNVLLFYLNDFERLLSD